MNAAWQEQPGPSITAADALRALADEPHLLCLHGGDAGHTWLAWGAEPQEIRAWDDLGRTDPGTPSTAAWDQMAWGPGAAGATVVQLDYEFPAVPGWRWQPQGWCAWTPDGRCVLHATDEVGFARLRADLARPARHLPTPQLGGELVPAWNADGHAERVERIRAWIAEGQIYQANLTLPFQGVLKPGPHRDLALFLRLIARSPAGYAGFFRRADRTVMSHSPECFLRAHGLSVTAEPIKGTRRRRPGHEAATRAELLASPKDRAELAMIIDLVRNDLGRVARPGSVRVEDPAVVVDLPHLHHLAGRIRASLSPGHGWAGLVAANHPCGSITGAPKRRAMELIHAVESGPRGAYCGCFGWLGPAGLELAVAIRCLELRCDALTFHAGGGIVADSVGSAEWDEVRAKAAALAFAVGGDL